MKQKICLNGQIIEQEVEEYIPTSEELIMIKYVEIEQQKDFLNSTDYKVMKCLEAKDSNISLPYDFEKIKEERNQARNKINELEQEIIELQQSIRVNEKNAHLPTIF